MQSTCNNIEYLNMDAALLHFSFLLNVVPIPRTKDNQQILFILYAAVGVNWQMSFVSSLAPEKRI